MLFVCIDFFDCGKLRRQYPFLKKFKWVSQVFCTCKKKVKELILSKIKFKFYETETL